MYHKHQDEHTIPADEFEAVYDVAHMVGTVEESKKLNERHGPMIIIAASGMMTGGPLNSDKRSCQSFDFSI